MNMKKNVAMAVMMSLGLVSVNALAVTTGNTGKVTFQGEVVDSPCNLAPGQDGTDVKVDFGQLSMSQLNKGVKTSEQFVLKLENCALTDDAGATKTAEITFNSTDVSATNASMLQTQGTATGLGIGINGYTFGTPVALKGLVDGNNDLRFTATAQQLATGTNVTAGDFMAITDFKIDYK
ncbi:fimbrial protein [Salmonella enterica]